MKLNTDSESINIISHFSQYLRPQVANKNELCSEAFKIRHNVYCSELSFIDEQSDQMETDEFDEHSVHCLIQHISTKKYAGTVRIVQSETESQLLPIEKFCINTIYEDSPQPKDFPREKICEISRLAVPSDFRRRKKDNFKGSATANINEKTYSETELRCFPFIAVSLYLSAAAVCKKKDILHVFVMMELRLARSLKFVGINFEQIGPVVEYHGKRAPFYINRISMLENLPPQFKNMLKHLMGELDQQAY